MTHPLWYLTRKNEVLLMHTIMNYHVDYYTIPGDERQAGTRFAFLTSHK